MNEKKTLNPVLILFLGACPAMALTANVLSALGIGLAALLVMLLSNLVLGALRKLIGTSFLAKAVVVSFFASLVGMLMNAFLPGVYQLLGVYAAVLAVNLLVFHSAEEADKASLGAGARDAVLTGLCFTAALVCMAVVREVLGSASFAGLPISFLKNYTIPLLAQAPGGFLVFAIELAVIQRLCPAKDGCACGLACAAAGCACEE